LSGPTLDFGCGVGELLARLPEGSKGLEYNHASVDFCRHKGLNVEWYDGYADNWCLSTLPGGSRFESMVVSHVLEHLEDPMNVLRALLRWAGSAGVRRVLVIVPGWVGYTADNTHRTYIDWEMLRGLLETERCWTVTRKSYFPININRVGNWFRYQELQALLEPWSYENGGPLCCGEQPDRIHP